MSVLFGAIDVGSYEIGLTINELSKKNGIRVIDQVRHRINLGTDTFRTGKISYAHVAELKKLLSEYRAIMDNYGVKDYKAYGTSAIREMVNSSLVLSEIEQQTGIHIDVLSNSEQRFLDYKSIACIGDDFQHLVQSPTAILDIGGSSIQVSLFDEDHLVSTQNMKLGVLRLFDQVRATDVGSRRFSYVVSELVDAQLEVFSNLYLQGKAVTNLIIVDDYISQVMLSRAFAGEKPGYFTPDKLAKLMAYLRDTNQQDIAKRLSISDDNIPLLYVSSILLARIVETMHVQLIWAPGVTLCDGMVYEYAEKTKVRLPEHNFDDDIIACARNTAARYMVLPERGEELSGIAGKIFDAMKKYHGLGKRERLLLSIAAALNDVGKYISMVDVGKCGYDIIMSTEIIGLSHIEREIVANVVKFNHEDFIYFSDQQNVSDLDSTSYLVIARLTAILRVAAGLDRSHQQKFHEIRAAVKDDRLVVSVATNADITMEKSRFGHRADFFEEVYGIRPVIRQTAKLS